MNNDLTIDKFSSDIFYPRLYSTLDEGAIQAQKDYFLRLKVENIVLISVPFFVLLATVLPDNLYMSLLPALLIVSVVLMSLFWSNAGGTMRWQSLRSLAESVKRETWFYFMKCDQYGLNDADTRLIEAEREILSRSKGLDAIVSKVNSPSDFYLSDYAQKNRNRGELEKFHVYKEKRLQDQTDWYSQKYQLNERLGNRYRMILFIALLATVTLALVVELSFKSLGGIVDVLIASILSTQSFVNARRFADLSFTYQNTFLELQSILEENSQVSETNVCSIVNKTEATISREHEIWSYRRGERI